jgi:hypothetical protein
MDNPLKKEDAGGQNAGPIARYLVPCGLPGWFTSLLSSIGASDPQTAHLLPAGNLLYDGVDLVGCYDTMEEAQAALRSSFEERYPGEPFSPELAWHGTDGQGRTRWSFCIITIPKLDGPSIREAIERAYNEQLLGQQQEERTKHPRTKLQLVADGLAFTNKDVFWVALQKAVRKHTARQTAPWPEPDELNEDPEVWGNGIAAKIDVMKMPYLSPHAVFSKLQAVLSEDQKALLSNPQTDERLRAAILDYLVAHCGDDAEKLRAAAYEWRLGDLPIEDGTIKRCPECPSYHTREEFCSEEHAARNRNRGRQKVGNGKTIYENAQARRDKKAMRHFANCRLRKNGQFCPKCEALSVPMSHADALNRRTTMKLENIEKAISKEQSGDKARRPTGTDELDD